METRDNKLRCPLCDTICDYKHIVDFHKEFWDNRFPVEQLPTNVEDFNKRFGVLGFLIKDLV